MELFARLMSAEDEQEAEIYVDAACYRGQLTEMLAKETKQKMWQPRTLLERACQRGHNRLLARYLAAGANAQPRNGEDMCPVLFAAASGNLEGLQLLARHFATISAHGIDQRPLSEQLDPSQSDCLSSLALAAAGHHVECIRFLLEQKVSPMTLSRGVVEYDTTALIVAGGRTVEGVELIAEAARQMGEGYLEALLHHRDSRNFSALTQAVFLGNPHTVRKLLDLGADASEFEAQTAYRGYINSTYGIDYATDLQYQKFLNFKQILKMFEPRHSFNIYI